MLQHIWWLQKTESLGFFQPKEMRPFAQGHAGGSGGGPDLLTWNSDFQTTPDHRYVCVLLLLSPRAQQVSQIFVLIL